MTYQIAMLWLINDAGELLLARRADTKKHDPGLWGPSVTGNLEANESWEEAVSRETEEELGLMSSEYMPNFLFETDFKHPDGDIRHFKVYVAHVPFSITGKIHADSREVAEVKWLSIPEIRKLLESKPGEVVVASAFVLWNRIFEAIDAAK